MKRTQRGIAGIDVLIAVAIWFGAVAISHGGSKPEKKAEAPQPQTEQVAKAE